MNDVIPELSDRASQAVLEVGRVESRGERERQLHDVRGVRANISRSLRDAALFAFGARGGVVLCQPRELAGGEASDLTNAAAGGGDGVQESEAGDVDVGVSAVTTRSAAGLDRLVAAFPDPEDVLGKSGSLGSHSDRVFGGCVFHEWKIVDCP